jgi:hypothetical protein
MSGASAAERDHEHQGREDERERARERKVALEHRLGRAGYRVPTRDLDRHARVRAAHDGGGFVEVSNERRGGGRVEGAAFGLYYEELRRPPSGLERTVRGRDDAGRELSLRFPGNHPEAQRVPR